MKEKLSPDGNVRITCHKDKYIVCNNSVREVGWTDVSQKSVYFVGIYIRIRTMEVRAVFFSIYQ
jgi:hypothetical protein